MATKFNKDDLELHKYQVPPENIVYIVDDINHDGDLRIYKCEYIHYDYEDDDYEDDVQISFYINNVMYFVDKDDDGVFFDYQEAFQYWKSEIKQQVKEYDQLKQKLDNLEKNMKKALLL